MKRGVVFLVGAGVAAITAAAGTPSPDVAQADDNDLREIIVTARRVEEPLHEVPISISVLSQRDIEDRNITSAADLSAYVPSLSTDQRYGGTTTTFNIRGFFQENVTTPTVGVYFADAVAPRGNSITNTPSGDGVGPGSLFDLQNVQVLKGPQGTLFGRNTTGGTILLVPQKPTGEFGGYAELSIGNYDLHREQAVLNVPITDTVRARFGVDRQQRDGWQDNISGIGPERFGGSNYSAYRASIVADLTPNLENYTVATYSKSDATPAINSIIACNPAQESPFGVSALVQAFGFCTAQLARAQAGGFYSVQNSLDGPIRQFNEQWQVINKTSWNVSDALTIKNIAAYGEFKADYRSIIFGENYILNPATVSASAPAGTAALAAALAGSRFFIADSSFGAHGGSAAAESTLSEELQFQGTGFDRKLNWQAGAYFERSAPTEHNTSAPLSAAACTNSSLTPACNDLLRSYIANALGFPVAFIPGIATSSDNFGDITYKDYAAYTQATYAIVDQFKVTGGLRYTVDEMDAVSAVLNTVGFPTAAGTFGAPTTQQCLFTATSLADGCTRENHSKTDAPTWLLDFEYLPTHDLMAYAKYARGYRQGGVQPRSPSETYGKEKIDAYEVGTKYSFSGPVSGDLNVAAYYNKLSNQQLQASYNLNNVFFQSILNIGTSEVYGVEFDGRLNYNHFHLDTSGAYLDTKITEAPTPAQLVGIIQAQTGIAPVIATFPIKGDSLPLTPKWRVVVTPSVDLPVPTTWGRMNLASTMVYTGEAFVTSADGYQGPDAKQNYNEATTLFNANLNWTDVGGKPIDVSLFGTNITGVKYYAALLGGWSNSVGSETARQGEPRMYGARLRVRF